MPRLRRNRPTSEPGQASPAERLAGNFEPGVDAARDDDLSVVEAELVAEDRHPVVAAPCPACGAPREGSSAFCGACGIPLEMPGEAPVVAGDSGSHASALPDHTFQCRNCGSQVATSLDQRSYVCPFCDSSYVTEIQRGQGRQRPEFVIGFAITAAQAKEKYFQWLGKNSWFRPGDLAERAIAEKQKGVYLPFWHFSMRAQSQWSANIGEYWYRTETYRTKDANGKTVTRTRQVRETEWFPLRGRHHRYYYGFLVPASSGLAPEEARAIQPFQLSALARYRPFYLAGWMAEEYSIDMQTAIEHSKAEFRRAQQAEIGRFLPGDTFSNLSVNTEFDISGSDLILLPVHVLSYRYRDQVFRFLVNGQTGKIVGQKPWSAKRVGALVAAILVAIAITVAVVALLANR